MHLRSRVFLFVVVVWRATVGGSHLDEEEMMIVLLKLLKRGAVGEK